MNKMSEEEAIEIILDNKKEYEKIIKELEDVRDANGNKLNETIQDCQKFVQAIETILDLYKELQNENARLKYLLRESSKIIDEYTNELENDTKKIIEYREKYLEKGDKNE